MHIVDSVGRLFGGDGDIAKEWDPIFFLREWVCWDLFQVVPACEVLQGCGRSVLMNRVIVEKSGKIGKIENQKSGTEMERSPIS